MSVFELYGIKDKVLSLTLDNASANNAAINLFKQTLKPPYGGQLIHQKCACHIINLVVQDGFKQFGQYLENVRTAIGFVRGSPKMQQEFAQACHRFDMPPKILRTDINTRWNATYLMLEAALPYQEVISAVYEAASSTPGELSRLDWQICECFYQFLKVFYDATVCLSGVYYPTSHHAIHKLYEIANQFHIHRNIPMFAKAVASMETKFKKYWEKVPALYCLAAVLDPRMKLTGVESLIRGIAEKLCFQLTYSIQDIRTRMVRMFNSYNEKYGASPTTLSTSTYPITDVGYASWQTVLSNPAFSHAAPSSSARSELENYFEINFSAFYTTSTGTIDFVNFDLLNFWRSQANTFPVLSRMARDILTIPVSTVASEQVFSHSGRVLEERRSRLSEDILEAQICIKDWEDARRRGQEYVDDLVGEFRDLRFNESGSSNTL